MGDHTQLEKMVQLESAVRPGHAEAVLAACLRLPTVTTVRAFVLEGD